MISVFIHWYTYKTHAAVLTLRKPAEAESTIVSQDPSVVCEADVVNMLP